MAKKNKSSTQAQSPDVEYILDKLSKDVETKKIKDDWVALKGDKHLGYIKDRGYGVSHYNVNKKSVRITTKTEAMNFAKKINKKAKTSS